jgi:hypothetical protein
MTAPPSVHQGERGGAAMMSWGFRKSAKVAPGVRVSAGKRGLGISFGRRGLRASANTGGEESVSASLLGLFFRKKL